MLERLIRLTGRFCAFLIAGVILPATAASQAPPPRALATATALLAEEFSEILSIRELRDGRILIADRREARVVVADLVTGRVTQVARRGPGPDEYSNVYRLLALGGDSTLMADPSARRWHLFDGARLSRTIPPTAPAFQATRGLIDGADAGGHLLAQKSPATSATSPPFSPVLPDTIVLIRVAMATGAIDSLGLMMRTPKLVEMQGPPGAARPESITIMAILLAAGEEPLLFPDGWLAVARVNPYRVDWRSSEGRWTFGAPLPFREIAVDDREKQAFIDRRVLITGRGLPPRPLPWAKTVPAFEAGALLALPNGNLLIARTPTADHSENRYDVVDRGGRLVSQLTLPLNHRIVGTGRTALYVVATRDDGIQQVRRHPLP